MALVVRLKAMRILLAFVAGKNIKLYQMDMKIDFPKWFYQRGSFCKQPAGIEDTSIETMFQTQKDFIWS